MSKRTRDVSFTQEELALEIRRILAEMDITRIDALDTDQDSDYARPRCATLNRGGYHSTEVSMDTASAAAGSHLSSLAS